jgi:DNA polymerase II
VPEYTGWLLDVYPDAQGVTVWLIGDDGLRRRLRCNFPVTFYAAGPAERLRDLWRWLACRPAAPALSRCERRDLFATQPLSVLAAQSAGPLQQLSLFKQVAKVFPDLDYYDADIALPLRCAAAWDTFPLGRCRVEADKNSTFQDIQAIDSPWELDPPAPPLRILRLEPDEDPTRRMPAHLLLRADPRDGQRAVTYRLELDSIRPLLINVRAILQRHDPDLLLTTWGDTWLLPRLIEQAHALGLPLPLSRDPHQEATYRPESSYFSYGQVIYRGRQVLLFGRGHIDCRNAMLWDDLDLEGALETARVTGLPLQTAARVSPGSGISAMQILTALRQGILVPWRKQQTERPRPALQMFAADQGGLVYQPLVGVHRDVGGIDFVSMYPGMMVYHNISPETAVEKPAGSDLTPCQPTGLVPQTLAPLLEKRLKLKKRLVNLPRWDPRHKRDQARAAAHKWLLVTCFGYLGYKNARFGRIEAHEAVTAAGREALLSAKETAEDLGYTVLHLYVDGLWVQKTSTAATGAASPHPSCPADYQPMLDEISRRTGLPISLDGIYRWVVFLPSVVDSRVPVANRYFGVFQDGSLKVRGIEARRGDTPLFIGETQMEILELLAADPAPLPTPQTFQRAQQVLRRKLADLRAGRVPLPALLISQRLSRELQAYHSPPAAARAAAQLLLIDRHLRPGQHVRFIYTRGEPGVYAWDLPEPPDSRTIDWERYTVLLLRAAQTVLAPFNVSVQVGPVQVALPAVNGLKLPAIAQ